MITSNQVISFGKINGYININEIMAFLATANINKTIIEDYLKQTRQTEEGHLYFLDDWNPLFALAVADIYKTHLAKDQWLLIAFSRWYMKQYKNVPFNHVVIGGLDLILNQQWSSLSPHFSSIPEKRKAQRKQFYQIFPYGSNSLCRYAGLPVPFCGNA